jgi:hypothetical protein
MAEYINNNNKKKLMNYTMFHPRKSRKHPEEEKVLFQ